ncbi:hypothetical protein EI555_006144, partial [Monodon monoceros]
FKAFPETRWAQGQGRRTEFCCYLLCAEPQPAPAFKELTDEVEEFRGQPGWIGAQTAAPAQTLGPGKDGEGGGGEAAGGPGTGLLPLRWKVRPHVSLLSFHYIQIRSAINFIKSKQSWSENGASRQSRGGLGRRNQGEQGRAVVAAVKRAGDGGPGEGASLQDSPSPGIPPFLWPSTSF